MTEVSQESEQQGETGGMMGFMRTCWGILTGRKRKKRSTAGEYAEALIVAVVLALIIRTFLFQAFRIPSGSMENTLLVGDFLFVNKFLYGAELPFTGGKRLPGFSDPAAGDIIVFRYPRDPSQDYIKRCVAVEGDVVEYKNKVLFVNGEERVEDFAKHAEGTTLRPNRDSFGPVTVPADHLFMMGDNRDRSADSRMWGFLPEKNIRGKALFIYFSWDGPRSRIRFSRLLDLIR
jgi:signal peptidase I